MINILSQEKLLEYPRSYDVLYRKMSGWREEGARIEVQTIKKHRMEQKVTQVTSLLRCSVGLDGERLGCGTTLLYP